MIKAIINWWRAGQRAIDLDVLWPACKRETPDLDHAKLVFAIHAFDDDAWLSLGEAEIVRRIEAMQ